MKKPIMIEDLCDYQYCSEITLSPDKRKASFVVSQGDMDKNNYAHHIYYYDFETASIKQLTSQNEKGVIWESNESILFSADRDKSAERAKEEFKECTNYYRLSLTGGEASKAFSIPLNVSNFKLIDDQYAVVVALKDVDEDHEKMSKEELQEEKDYEVLDELPYWFNGRGFINKKRKQVYLVNYLTSEVTLLTPKMMETESILLSPDKQTLIVVGNQYQDVNNQYTCLLKVDLNTKECSELLDQETMNIHHLAMIEDTLVFTGTDFKTWGTSENLKFYKMNLTSGEYSCFFDQEISVGSSVGSDAKLYGGQSFMSENGLIYMTSTVDNCSNIFTLDLKGNLTQLTNKEGCVDCFSVKEDRLVFIGMRDMKLQEVYEVKDHVEYQLTSINHALDDKEVLPLEKLSFTNLDDIRIDGWVIKPRGYEKGKKYPAIYDIHGGPKGVYGETFFHEMQVWASMGYFVMFTNPRGSDGRGNEFMHLVNKYGTVDYSDLMEFCDQVLEKYPDIDTDKIAVTGGSYGGFMVNWIIGHTNRFCCAASQRSISNWVSKSLTTDIGYYHNMSQMASTPWENFDRMWSFSPIKYADKCTTPTLFIHSNEDYRCWMAEGLQMFQALKIHNVDARMCLFKG
ncbi:MAG: S9 family peptidase, partial [Erysipelotrichaceae bacterium]